MTGSGARTALTLIVSTVWAVTTLASVVTGKYGTLEAVTPVMTIVAGFLFSARTEFDKPARKRRTPRKAPSDA